MVKHIRKMSFFFLLLVAGCDIRVLDPASETGRRIEDLIGLSFWMMMLVLVIVFILFIHFIKKYRVKDDSYVPPEEKENKWLEISWTVLPIILLIILAIPTVIATYNLTYKSEAEEDSLKKEGLHVEVTAGQFSFTFTYPNGKESTNQLLLPVDREVTFTLTSKDVIHSFWVPELSGKIDAIPGKQTHLKFTPNQVGGYQGKCAEFCGSHHAMMRFTTRVVEQDTFTEWMDK
ncbi:cytochrome c oxidase subunit II [Salimicrobium halophilum]|uniref:Cytochrome c oxidase subunit 2 n=1 Tax=Salimicrobium halophilum TaxID=86666 RepID=A0A1G8TWZ3_9BACI|nr:cytochrome c oxidase subunit II [Salimicrobium halophilum]SDJ46078.1 cytochrome c oxidase subunit 2 [Salimicrobium halophilum]